MSDGQVSRRRWLAASPLGVGSAFLALHWPDILSAQEHAHEAMRSAGSAAFSILSAEEAREIEALTSQIIPTDSSPGAREAGVIYFIDRALTTFDADKRPLYTAGLKQTQAARRDLFPASQSIAGLRPDELIRLLQTIEKTEFFEMVRTHTILGFFGNPSYGGNRNLIGWKLIGFEDRFQFEPPFGFYDGPDGGERKR
jgi:gluconate 2-dehydrogenase gamma chain